MIKAINSFFSTQLPWSPEEKGVRSLRSFKEQFWLVEWPNSLCCSKTSPVLEDCLSPDNPGTKARFQNPIVWLHPLFWSVSRSYWGSRNQRRERTCACAREMSNCISLINEICDPKYLLHSKGTSSAFKSTFSCWVREPTPFLSENPSLIPKGKWKFSCVVFCGSLEMLNAHLSYGKMEGMIYWPSKYKPIECCLRTALFLLAFNGFGGERSWCR